MFVVMICRALRCDVGGQGYGNHSVYARESPTWGFAGPFGDPGTAEEAARDAVRSGAMDARIVAEEFMDRPEFGRYGEAGEAAREAVRQVAAAAGS